MKTHDLPLQGLKLIELQLHRDSRGFFVERFQEERFHAAGLPYRFMQDNHSRSAPRVLRGLHFQSRPAQGKLVGVVHGRIWDVVVDIRPDSKTFGKHYGIELSDQNGLLLWIPPGFAHGFCVVGDEPADLLYKVDAVYDPRGEGGIRWDDPDLGIAWPVQRPTVSDRDQKLISFRDFASSLPKIRT